MKSIAFCMIAVGLTFPSARGAEGDVATAALSPETRAFIVREMQAIADAMGRIHRALVTGDHAAVAEQAGQIHASFVLAQELTRNQRHELHSRLPADFLAADRHFHDLAKRLALAAGEEDPDLQRFWFAEMTRACQDCHADHAGKRFPGLRAQGSDREPPDNDH